MKIITFAKPGYPQQFQALIQYMDPKAAQIAKENYDGQNLYYGCCPLKVEYSKLTNLNVKYNNEKSRDFTRPDLPTGEPNTPSVLQPLDQTTLALGKDPECSAYLFCLKLHNDCSQIKLAITWVLLVLFYDFLLDQFSSSKFALPVNCCLCLNYEKKGNLERMGRTLFTPATFPEPPSSHHSVILASP